MNREREKEERKGVGNKQEKERIFENIISLVEVVRVRENEFERRSHSRRSRGYVKLLAK